MAGMHEEEGKGCLIGRGAENAECMGGDLVCRGRKHGIRDIRVGDG